MQFEAECRLGADQESGGGIMGSVELTNAALYEDDGEIVLRGVLTPESLPLLKVADYQREILPGARAKNLEEVLSSGSSLPDITLGMRGGQFTERKGGAFSLEDRVFIIDGLQRTNAAIKVAGRNKDQRPPRLGAVVYFNTTESSERVLFRQLNTLRTKLSANVLLYNERHLNPQVKLLYDLCQDSSFTLYQRVSWKQLMGRSHLINATGLVRNAAALHGHFGGGDMATYDIIKIANNLTRLKIPRTAIRDNVKTFWQVVDTNWKVRDITFKEYAPHIRQTFLLALTALFNRHEDFWEDSVLKVPLSQRNKLATFPLQDPGVSRLCSAGGSAANILLPMLVDHMNSGKKLYRLREFNAIPVRNQVIVEEE
jgi:hypothetical protein